MTHEGSLGILRYQSTVPNMPEEYDVTYARYDLTGGVLRARRLRGREALVSFLAHDVHLNGEVLKGALEMVDTQRSASIPNVTFTDDEIARLRLAA